jgi:histidine ammonia-lyase
MGEWVDDRQVRAAMVARLNTLLRGDSGVSVELLTLLCTLINAGVTPLVPRHGGVGASGDLIQLSHIALALAGEGDVRLKEERMSAAKALATLKQSPHVFGPKEGLALINGTSFMTAVAALCAYEARTLFGVALRSGALALEAAECFEDCLAEYLHAARPHKAQGEMAAALRSLLRGSKLLRSREKFERSFRATLSGKKLPRAAQDVYSLRCTPQILGPLVETLRATERTITIELNSATDNPLVDVRGRKVLHGGNFHGEYIAHAADALKVAVIKLTMLSERRLNFFLHAEVNGLFPPFLNLGTPGLTLGLQGLQFTATSTTAASQSLGYPHSLHSIPSNADNQDVVSMGADAALVLAEVVNNASMVFSCELVALSQACAFGSRERKLSIKGKRFVQNIRKYVALVKKDRSLSAEMQKLAAAMRRGEAVRALEF